MHGYLRRGYGDAVTRVVSVPEPLRQYALLADGERGALVGPRGDIGFLCAPRWHDDAVFAGLLGGPGSYSVTPRDHRFVWGGYYEQDSLVWRSRWVTTTEIIECREALALPAESHRLVLLRQVRATAHPAPVRARLQVSAGFGHHPMTAEQVDDHTWEGHSGPVRFRWSGVPDGVREVAEGLEVDLTVPAGHRHDLVLEISEQSLPHRHDLPDAGRLWEQTAAAWDAAVPELGPSISSGDSRHAYAVLRGLTSGSGAMVAAATTALPERAEQQRDYDYRYAWVRDQCYAGQAAAAAGGAPLLDAAVSFVTDRLLADGARLRPAYRVDGEPLPSLHTLDLPGYPGAPVSLGNGAGEQFQLDTFGEALSLLAAADRRGRLDAQGWRAAEVAAAAVAERAQDPDGGLWELEDRWWTQSRLACAAGLRAAAQRRDGELAADWEKLADALLDECRRRGRHPEGHWQRSPEDPAVDAGLLLPAIRGAVPADDPVVPATIAAVIDQLTDDGYVYRFRHDQRPMHEAEGAFVLCNFHLAMASAQQGDTVAAARWFERGRSALGPPGLFTEEFDVVQRQLRGNLPQAFVHAGLLESAARLAATDAGTAGFDQRHREEHT